jgi:hypothetical protein
MSGLGVGVIQIPSPKPDPLIYGFAMNKDPCSIERHHEEPFHETAAPILHLPTSPKDIYEELGVSEIMVATTEEVVKDKKEMSPTNNESSEPLC